LAGILVANMAGGALRRVAVPFGVVVSLFQAVIALGYRLQADHPAFFILSVDALSRMLLLAIAVVTAAALLTGLGTLENERKRFNFTNLTLLAMIGMNGVAMVQDLFSLYVFLEIASVSSFILIALNQEGDGLEGAFKYLLLSALATLMLLASIAIFMLFAGGTSFGAIKGALEMSPSHTLIYLGIALFLGGTFVKSGLMPFHGWLPDAYTAAPAGVSVLLAGIVTKTTGVYVLIRFTITLLGFPLAVREMLLFIGLVSIIGGALAAIGQNDFKRMLAYSSISQVGYIILSLGAGTALGVAGAIFHLFNHAVFKSLLFVNAAAVEKQTGIRDMDAMGGLAERMPMTGLTSVIGLLSTAGVPPLAGFWSKLVIIVALWQAGHTGYAVAAVLASLLTLAYFLSMQRRVFFGVVKEGFGSLREAEWRLIVPAAVLALITIGVGLLIPMIFGSFLLPGVRSL
jgi:multicomponent Na+:H+ antiporter subunit D